MDHVGRWAVEATHKLIGSGRVLIIGELRGAYEFSSQAMLNLLGALRAVGPGRHICVCAFDANPTPIGGGLVCQRHDGGTSRMGEVGVVRTAPPFLAR